MYEKYTTITRLLKLLFIIISVAHYTACGFLYIGKLEKVDEFNWIYTSIYNKNNFGLYVDAFYFSVITMSTVGYVNFFFIFKKYYIIKIFLKIININNFFCIKKGDISPISLEEKLYVIIMTIVKIIIY